MWSLCAFVASSLAAPPGGPVPVEVRPTESGFSLYRGGEPYVIRGAGGDGDLEALAALGANSVRTWGADDLEPRLDRAHALGLTVTIGIWLGHERHGFDYNDDDQVAAQIERARAAVLRYRDHPALLMWGVGNEMEGFEAGDDAAIWSAVNNVAAMVQSLDPHHPVMTVLAEVGGKRVANVHRLCPAVDVVGVNSYGGATTLVDRYRSAGGTKPLVLTEYGPPGAWEVPKTGWGAPKEPTSAVKARAYAGAYRAFHAAPEALGSYAFTWGNKREATATWFGLLLPDGTPLETVDRLQFLWTGAYPDNRSPSIVALQPKGAVVQAPGATLEVSAMVTDPEGDEVELSWVLEPEAREHVTGGDPQTEPRKYPEALEVRGPRTVRVRLPERPGGYRLYAYARDGRGASTANLPLRVKGPVAPGEDPGEMPVVVLGNDDRWIPSGYMGRVEAIRMKPETIDGREGLRVAYTEPGHWGGVVWQHPANDWGDRPGGFDLSGARRLVFFAKGASGGERVKFGFGLLGSDKKHPDSSGLEKELVLESTWKRYVLDLEGRDLSLIKSGFYWVVGGAGQPVEFHLADVRYE